MVNSYPLGFYTPSQLVQDAVRHGVEVRPVDVQYSQWDCTLERNPVDEPALRLGLRLVKGFGEPAALRICTARANAQFLDIDELAGKAYLSRKDL